MPDPVFQVSVAVVPPAPTVSTPGQYAGGVRAVGAAFQPVVAVFLFDKTSKQLVARLYGPRACPLPAGCEASWAALGANTELPMLPPGEYALVATAWDSPGSALFHEDRASFVIEAPPGP